jgi:hypothetical protein
VKQALHIFKKDVRYLRWELGASLLFTATFAYAQIHRDLLREGRAFIGGFLFAAFWGFLCARLIQAEAIPGDRQFWITRPYDWRSLLTAKLLFVVAFISAPLLVADAVVLAREGFSVPANVPGLLWSVGLVTAGLVLMLCALATLTRGLAQWMLSLLFTVGAFIGLDWIGKGNVWGGVQWIRDHGDMAIWFATASVILLWQYKHRRTAGSIAMMAAGLIGSWLYGDYGSSTLAFEAQMRLSKPKADPSAIQLTFHPSTEHAIPQPEPYIQRSGRETLLLALPVDVSGLGEGMDVMSDEVEVAIQDGNGKTWDVDQNIGSTLQHRTVGYRQILNITREDFEKTKARPVRLRLTLYLTLLGNPASKVLRAGAGLETVRGIGRCEAMGDHLVETIECISPLRDPSNVLVANLGPNRGRFFVVTSYSPFPADSSISPLHWYTHGGAQYGYRGSPEYMQATLISLEPLAHFRRDLDLRDVYLADYQARPQDY